MNSTATPGSRHDAIVTAIAVLVLMLGTATGNAYAMFAVASFALVILAVFFRQRAGRQAWLLAGVAAAVAAVMAIAITRL